MRFPKPLTIAMPAALVVLSVAGCGGGSDSTASTAATTTEATPTLSKAELISQGDAICAEVNAAVGSVGTSGAAVPQQVTQVSDLYIGMVDSIQRLGTPAEPAGYSEFIEAAEELSTVEGEAKLAAEREDTTALGEAATKAAPALEEFETQAGVYGFEDCSKGPSAPTPSGTGAAPSEEEGGVEVAPEVSEEPEVEEAAPEEAAPETGGAGGGVGEAAPEGGGTGGGTSGGGSGGVGPG
jgi:uncharacterized membrane protein YgcG